MFMIELENKLLFYILHDYLLLRKFGMGDGVSDFFPYFHSTSRSDGVGGGRSFLAFCNKNIFLKG